MRKVQKTEVKAVYRIHEIKLKLGEPLDRLPGKIIKKIGVRGLTIGDWRVVKESIDARDKKNIFMVYSQNKSKEE